MKNNNIISVWSLGLGQSGLGEGVIQSHLRSVSDKDRSRP